MQCCRTCWLSVYNTLSLQHFYIPTWASTHYKGGTKTNNFLLGISNRGACPHSHPSHSTTNNWHNSIPAVCMSIPGVFPIISPPPHFGPIFSCQHFGTKLVSITFSLRPKEVLLFLTLQKLVWIYYCERCRFKHCPIHPFHLFTLVVCKEIIYLFIIISVLLCGLVTSIVMNIF